MTSLLFLLNYPFNIPQLHPESVLQNLNDPRRSQRTHDVSDFLIGKRRFIMRWQVDCEPLREDGLSHAVALVCGIFIGLKNFAVDLQAQFNVVFRNIDREKVRAFLANRVFV